MGFDFSIMIEGPTGAAAKFIPQGGAAGEPLKVWAEDIVSWGNRTGEIHHPWQTDENHVLLDDPQTLLCDPIEPRQPSEPGWPAPAELSGTTIYYRCKTHPNRDELGLIEVA